MRSSNRVGIDFCHTRYRTDDYGEEKYFPLIDIISEISKNNKSIAATYSIKGFDNNIYNIVKQEKKIVLVHNLYALYLSNYFNENKAHTIYIAQLCKRNMEVLTITYIKEKKQIDCKVEIVDDYSETKLINNFKPIDESENDLENLILMYRNDFNHAIIEYISKLETYFSVKTDDFRYNVYFHFPNYIDDISIKTIKTKLILDFSNDFSIGAIRFADCIYSINTL